MPASLIVCGIFYSVRAFPPSYAAPACVRLFVGLRITIRKPLQAPLPRQALLDLLEPYFHPILDDLLDDVEAGRAWTLAHVPEAIKKMNANIIDIAHLIPPSFYQVSLSHKNRFLLY